MRTHFWIRGWLVCLLVSLICLVGCPEPRDGGPSVSPDQSRTGRDRGDASPAASVARSPVARAATANAQDVNAAKSMLEGLGGRAKYTLSPDGALTGIVISDGSALTPEHIGLFGKLTDLERLQIFNCRELNDEMAAHLSGLKNLTSLALTNSVIGDSTVQMIAESFPNLKELDLSSNTNITNSMLKVIGQLVHLEQLVLMQNRFNDLGTSHLSKLTQLRSLDLRGNMEVGDMTMEIVGALPKLAALKHRSTTVSDFGMEYLAQCKTLKSLLMQDFNITSQAGQHIAALGTLTELEVFRCQGFGSDGVLALKGMKLVRLTLRDLPMVDDQAMTVLGDLAQLKRLYLHELASVSDTGLANLASLKELELLDIWALPQMTDATVDSIAALPKLKELSIRTTGVTDAAVDKLLALPSLASLTFKDNGAVTAAGLDKLSGKKWSKLDTGSAP